MRKALVIKSTGETEIVELPDDNSAEYELLKETLQGWIQPVSLDQDLDGFVIWVNEEGKLERLPINSKATKLWEISYGKTDIIVGNAIITGDSDNAGKVKGLTETEIQKLLSLVA